MVSIEFQNGDDWFGPNWVFRQFRSVFDVVFEDDVALRDVLEMAEVCNGCSLKSYEPEVALKILQAIRDVAEKVVHRGGADMPSDKYDAGYVKSIAQLLEKADRALGSL